MKNKLPLIALVLGVLLLGGLIGLIQYTRSHASVVTDINMSNAKEVIANTDLPVYIEFYSPNCHACQNQAPIVEKVAQEYAGKVKFTRVNVDQNAPMAQAMGVTKLPTHFMLNKKLDQIIGYPGPLTEAQLRTFVEAGMAKQQAEDGGQGDDGAAQGNGATNAPAPQPTPDPDNK